MESSSPDIADPPALDKGQAVLSHSSSSHSSPTSSSDSDLAHNVAASISNTSPPSRPSGSISELEAEQYYYGLHSKPILVARTGNVWAEPTPGAFLQPKHIMPVSRHSALKAVWEDDLAFKIHDVLESKEVQWTSTDVVKIGLVGEAVLPTVLWIGVLPKTLSSELGLSVARECKEVLTKYQILDIEVEIRESVVTRCHNSTANLGPSFLETDTTDGMAEFIQPLTTTMGSSICSHNNPTIEGTGGFYVSAPDTQKLYLVTARHVLLPLTEGNSNSTYDYKNNSQPKIRVALFGTDHFKHYTETIPEAIRTYENEISLLGVRRRREELRVHDGTLDPEKAVVSLDEINTLLNTANRMLPELRKLNKELEQWKEIDNRIIGHVRFSPPIEFEVGPQGYTQDYALIEMDVSKLNKSNFIGNALDLGISSKVTLKEKVFPNPANKHTFDYPSDRLLKIRGTIPYEDMVMKDEKKAIMDKDGDPCLIVMKRGKASGLTVGRANGIWSYVRTDLGNGFKKSKEWSICSYDKASGPFSLKGDSGAAVVDHSGRLGGLLTGGQGLTESNDLTYVTPITFILDSLKANGFRVTTEL